MQWWQWYTDVAQSTTWDLGVDQLLAVTGLELTKANTQASTASPMSQYVCSCCL